MQEYSIQSAHKGFTLIELVIVIVILGILAAAAIPRFVNLDTEARLSVVGAMRKAVTTGATLSHSKAVIDGVDITTANVTVDLDGDRINEVLAYGYPDSADQRTMEWIVTGLEPFTYAAGRYNLSDTSNCYVQYTNATLGSGPTISTVTGGC